MQKHQDRHTPLEPLSQHISGVLPDQYDAACSYFYATPQSKILQKVALTAEVVGLAAYVPVVGPAAAFALAAWSLYFFSGPVRALKQSTYLPINWSLPTVQQRMTDHLVREQADRRARARAAAGDKPRFQA